MSCVLVYSRGTLFRECLAKTILDMKFVKDVRTVGNPGELPDAIREFKPDSLVVDIYSRNYGDDVLGSICANLAPEKIILHTTRENKHLNYYNAVHGISHFVYAEDSIEVVKYSLEKCLSGCNGFMDDSFQGILTNRECEVLRLIALGKTSREIAEQLCISKNTVDTHRNKMLQKLNMANSASLVQFAYNTGLI